jgi:DNA-binding MarR family transcriptional regulator
LQLPGWLSCGTSWQVLNTPKENLSPSREQILDTLHAFIDSDQLGQIIARLIERGRVERTVTHEKGMEAFQLTQEGQHRHEAIFATQKAVRQWAMQGISEEEYATVIRVLERIVSNLNGGSVTPA